MTTATDQASAEVASDGPSVSVLFPPGTVRPDEWGDRGGRDGPDEPDPAVFADLNLDQIIAAVTRWRDDYDLVPLFRRPVHDPGVIAYRHEVMRDLDAQGLVDAILTFARGMQMVRQYRSLAATIGHRHERAIWLLEGAKTYATAVRRLAGDLRGAHPASRGLQAVADHLDEHVDSPTFTGLVDDANEVSRGLATVTYHLHFDDLRVTVSADDDPVDHGRRVEATFERFRHDARPDQRREAATSGKLNDVEVAVLDRVVRLHPEIFAALDRFRERYEDHLDATIVAFDREIQFYLAYLDHITPIRRAGLGFCYPEVRAAAGLTGAQDRADGSASSGFAARGAFDLALAGKLVARNRPVVTNDIELTGHERILVVSGANQGGKTTFARTVGQLHHLASIGCPVPARDVQLSLPDRIFTHFAHEERLEDRRGRLQDDLIRAHQVLDRATSDSLVILNEIFSSTTLADARELGSRVLRRLQDIGVLGVYVTFVDELATLGPSIVSMVATVEADDPARRTFEVVRRPADGRAFARALADKHGLTYERLRDRLRS